MAKYDQFAEVMEKRILRGDYTLDGLPTEQELADEVGLSRITARRALQRLMDKGVISRKPHGRLTINARHERLAGKARIALLTPAYSSAQYDNWIHAVERVGAGCHAMVRVVHYVHWNDPVIPQSLGSFDGVFLVPSSESIPQLLLKRFEQAENLIVLDGNLTEWGIPSLQTSQAMLVQQLADHLYELGHRRIDCLNTQPHDRVIAERLEQWTFWKTAHKVVGEMHDQPVKSYAEPTSQAYTVIDRLLSAGQFEATALLCTTEAGAYGASRALHEHGRVIGRDVSVCAVDGGKTSRFAIPSRTAFEVLEPDPYVEACMQWLISGGGRWEGPLLIQPGKTKLFIGESTGPAPASPNAS